MEFPVRLVRDLLGVQKNFDFLKSAPKITTGTVPPSPATDGDIFIYNADTTNGVKWMFQYREAGASGKKWEFIGGPPLLVTAGDAGGTNFTSTSFTGLGSGVTVPLLGDYQFGFSMHALPASTFNVFAQAGYAAAAPSADNASAVLGTSAIWGSLVRESKFSAVPAASVLQAYVRTTGGTATWRNLTHRLLPIRVG